MSEWVIILGWLGIFAPVALGAIGSVYGCAVAGQSAMGDKLETESGYGRFIGLSVLPSTFVIYGIVLMFALRRVVTVANGSGLFAIGFLAGLALWYTAVWQGRLCVASINTSKEKPDVLALSMTPIALVEGFGVFVFIFGLVLAGGLSGEGVTG
ncbi:MAG: ATP synthase subunit C [Gammaproteobacteria bacterium]